MDSANQGSRGTKQAPWVGGGGERERERVCEKGCVRESVRERECERECVGECERV